MMPVGVNTTPNFCAMAFAFNGVELVAWREPLATLVKLDKRRLLAARITLVGAVSFDGSKPSLPRDADKCKGLRGFDCLKCARCQASESCGLRVKIGVGLALRASTVLIWLSNNPILFFDV